MDFLNPKKRRANKIRLYIGYVFMAILLMLGTTVLLYQAYGYDLGQGGQVYQNGLLYLSSAPSSAQIYLNGSLSSSATNSRLELPAGQYTVKLALSGYRSWQRAIGLDGGSVEHFDYPILFPTKLVPAVVQQYASQPGLVLQSPSHRWLIVEQPGSLTSFTQYDVSNPKQLAANTTTLLLPPNVLTASPAAGQSLKLIAWSDDNNYLLIEHNFGTSHEYILFNRTSPSDSLNLTNQLQLSEADQLSFNNSKYDQYYVFDSTSGTVGTSTLEAPAITPLLKAVISFKTYGNGVVLYASASTLPDKVNINLLDSGKQYMIRSEPAGTTYLLNLTKYSGDWYVVIGATSDNRIYVYKNPMDQPTDQLKPALVPDYILKVSQPSAVEFSPNAQF
ncbi:MAG: PEGA domain-containing protein, partial [Candidatus Saccharimonadales bacterium]